MKNSYFGLNALKNEIGKLGGIIFFSIYQLPQKKQLRQKILNFFLKKKKRIYFALEDVELKNMKDIQEIELIFFISKNSNNF